MTKYLLERAIGMVAVMFIVVTVVILIVRLAPGDPAAVMLGSEATPQDIIDLRQQLGLDQPLFVQYVQALGHILRGDLGHSIFLNRPVLTAIIERTEPTLLLAIMSLTFASLIAIPIGVFAAYKRGSVFDQGVVALAMLSASIPSFWLVERPLLGEVVRLEGSSKHFVVEEPEREASRLAQFDIHLTGPMVGPKCLPAHSDALALEERALSEAGVDDELRTKLYAQVPGTRRDLFVRVRDYGYQINGSDVTLSFTLPSGSYATLVVKQLTMPRPTA